jgi:hypothetical protein
MSGSENSKKIRAIACRFLQEYYSKFFDSASSLLPFYSEQSYLFHGQGVEIGESIGGTEKIGEALSKMDNHGGSVDIDNGTIDIQPSANDGYLVVVTGFMRCSPNAEPRHFLHTFCLAKTPKGKSLFVLNDCLRFLGHQQLPNENKFKKFSEDALDKKKQEAVVTENINHQTDFKAPSEHQVHTVTIEPETKTQPVKESNITESNEKTIDQSNQGISGAVAGWGQGIEEDDDENDSDYVPEEDHDDLDDDDDEEEDFFDDHDPINDHEQEETPEHEHEAHSTFDVAHDLPPKREGKWVPKKKPDQVVQPLVDVYAQVPSVQPRTIHLNDDKKIETTQPLQQKKVSKTINQSPKLEKSQAEEEIPSKPFSYASIAAKSSAVPSAPPITKKKSVAANTPSGPTTSAPTVNLATKNEQSIFVGGIREPVLETELRELFQNFGTIKELKYNPDNTFAFIQFESASIVQTVIESSKTQPFQLPNFQLKVDFAKNNLKGGSRPGTTSYRQPPKGNSTYNYNNRSFNKQKK